MKFTIKNFNNIKCLEDVEIEDGKINFIYGISGSGKSSIAKGLTYTEEQLQKHKTFGCDEDPKIINSNDFRVFNDNSIQKYIFERKSDGLYDVIKQETEEMRKIRMEIDEIIRSNEISTLKETIDIFSSNFLVLLDKLKLKINKGGNKFTSNKMTKELSSDKDYTKKNDDLDLKHKKWIKDGKSYCKDETCPFCFQKIDELNLSKIQEILDELPEEVYTIIENSECLEKMHISLNPDDLYLKNNRVEIKEKLEELLTIEKDCSKIKNFLNINISDDDSFKDKDYLQLNESTINYFKENYNLDIEKSLNSIQKNSEIYLQKKQEYNNKFKSSIRRNLKKINMHIENFGIKYQFETKNIDSIINNENYVLKHINSLDEINVGDYLSSGEKNIIALILFLYEEPNDIIIDDPASSFDEYRRDKILDLIIDYHSKNKNTIIICSHDQIFLKFIKLKFKGNKKDYFGKIYHLTNNDSLKTELKEINPVLHIKLLVEHIQDNIEKIFKEKYDYFRIIINLRLLAELSDTKSEEYSYLSALLHNKNISEDIRDNAIKKILDFIPIKNNDWKEKFKKDLETNMDNQNNHEVQLTDFSNFEKICYIREKITNQDERKELNNIIHFNEGLVHMLNPFIFDFQSEKSYEILKKHQD